MFTRSILSLIITVVGLQFCLAQVRYIHMEPGTYLLKNIFDMIQSQCGYAVFYSDEIVMEDMTLTVDTKQLTLDYLLNKKLKDYHLAYQFLDKKILVISDLSPTTLERARVANKIEGQISDIRNEPLPYATVRVLKGDSIIGVTVADELGRFDIALPTDKRQLLLEVSSLGYKSVKKSFDGLDRTGKLKLTLNNDNTILETVTITENRSPYVRQADRMIVNVEGTMLANGLSTLELLQRSPNLWVDHNGNIRIRGNQSVIVMIDDIIQRMSTEQLAEYLRSIPSENIKRIEIISNPGAEYEAQGLGGIVKIVMKKGTNDGFKVILLARYIQNVKDPYFNGGTLFDYKNKRLYLSGAVAYTKDNQRYKTNYNIQYPDDSKYLSNTQRFKDLNSYNARLTANYEIAKNQNIGLQTIWTNSISDQNFHTNNAHQMKGDTLHKATDNVWKNRPTMVNSTFNYSLKIDTLESIVKVIADYLYNDNRESNHYRMSSPDNPTPYIYQNLSPSTTHIYSIQADLNKKYQKDFSFATGIKYVQTKRNNTVKRNNFIADNWQFDSLYSNQFIYNEDLVMGYFTLDKKINNFSIKAGLRAEQTFIDGLSMTSSEKVKQNYLNLFPSIFLLQSIGKKGTSIHLNYGKRVRRPSFKDLNPYTLQIDDFVLIQGNVNLQPEYIHRIETGITLKNGISVDLFYSNTQDKIVQFTTQVNNRQIKYQSINFKNGIDYGSSAFLPFTISSFWRVQSSLSFFKSKFEYDNVNLSQQVFEGSLFNFLKVSKLFDVNLYLSYRTPSYIGNTKYADQFYSSVMFSRGILNGKGKITLQANDLFNTAREREFSSYEGTIINFYQKRPTRTCGLSFTYTITKGKKFEDKKIIQSNDEQRKRVN